MIRYSEIREECCAANKRLPMIRRHMCLLTRRVAPRDFSSIQNDLKTL